MIPPVFAGVELTKGLVPAEWLISGDPETRSKVIGKSADGTSYVVLWECGSVTMRWHYDRDEALVILDGEGFVTGDDGVEHRYGPGDILLCPRGSAKLWRVPGYVRKVAFLKINVPGPLAFASRAWHRLTSMLGSQLSGL